MNVRKFNLNKKKALKLLNKEDCLLDLETKMLGIIWNAQSDKLVFKLEKNEKVRN